MNRPSARRVLPEFTERTSAGTRTLDPSSTLPAERIVFLGTRIGDASANDGTAQVGYPEHRDPDRDVSLCVDSPGGSFGAMSTIHDTLRSITGDAEAIRLGRTGPAASVLPAAGTPGKRYVPPGARMVLRQSEPPAPVEGRAGDLVVRADELPCVRAGIEELLARYRSRSPEQVRQGIGRERTPEARQAPEYGPADRIAPNRGAARTTSGAR